MAAASLPRVAAPILVISGPSGVGKTTVARLVAAAFDPSVHMGIEAFWPFVVNGWVEPWMPSASHLNSVLGGAVAAAAIQFALGGYTVVIDGQMFPEGADGMAQMCSNHGVQFRYAVLSADLDACAARVAARLSGEPADTELFARGHGLFSELCDGEANAIDASGSPEAVARAVLSAAASGRLSRG